jgi:hypothetical protein
MSTYCPLYWPPLESIPIDVISIDRQHEAYQRHLLESSHVPMAPMAPFVSVGQPQPPPTPSATSGIFVCSSDANLPLNLTPHHNHNSSPNMSVGALNANIPQTSTPSGLTNDTTCHMSTSGSCSRPQHSPPPQNPQRLVGMTNMYTPNPPTNGPNLQTGAHHLSAEVLVDPNGAFQSEVIIHSTPDTAHSHLHHHVHQHHYHPTAHPPRLHFGVSPPGFHISISPAGIVAPVCH